MSEKGEVKMTGSSLPRKAVLPAKETIIYTPDFVYLSPEVLQGQTYVTCADMYAFAILTLELKGAQIAFPQKPKYSLEEFSKVASSAREHLESYVNSLTFSQQIVQKLLLCLEKDMSKRPNALELAAEFKGRLSQRKRNVATPKKIFSRAFSSKRK